MSSPLSGAAPMRLHEDAIDATLQEAPSAFDLEFSRPGTRSGQGEDRASGSSPGSKDSKPWTIKQVGGALDDETPLPHVFSKLSRKVRTAPDVGGRSQKLLAHQNAAYDGLAGVQFSEEGSRCPTYSSVDHETFDPFAHLLGSLYVLDNGRRPRYRYATLIGMAILSADNRRLTLSQIYKWISVNFPYYSMAEGCWQNSIRHNLSLNKNFVRIERSKHERGKGHYWAIRHGQEHLFSSEESRRSHRAPATEMAAGNLQSIHGSTDCFSPEGGVSTASNTEQAGKAPDLRDSMRQDCPDHTTQSSHGTIEPTIFDQEEYLQQGAFSQAPPTASTKTRPLRKHGASPLSWSARSHRMGTQSGLKAEGTVNELRFGLPKRTPIAHVDPAQLTLQAGTKRLRFGKQRAEAEIARIRESNAKGRRKYKANNDLPVSSMNPSSRRIDSILDDSSTSCGFEGPGENSPSVSPDSMLRAHRENVRALLGSSFDPMSPTDEANAWHCRGTSPVNWLDSRVSTLTAFDTEALRMRWELI